MAKNFASGGDSLSGSPAVEGPAGSYVGFPHVSDTGCSRPYVCFRQAMLSD
jgi:hypothetical protein